MGISAGGDGGGPKSDINVTPLVDVVLVLLIIFLVTMPVMMRHITIEVPRKLDSEFEVSVKKTITVTGNADGSIQLNDGSTKKRINRVDLAKTLRELIDEMQADEKTVFVEFEDGLAWKECVSLMDTVMGVGRTAQSEGEVKIAIKTREEAGAGDAVPAAPTPATP